MRKMILVTAALAALAARGEEPRSVAVPTSQHTAPTPLPELPKTPEQVAAEAWAAEALAAEERANAEKEKKERQQREAAEKARAAAAVAQQKEAAKPAAASQPANFVERLDAGSAARGPRAPLTAPQALWRSALVPGLGQIQSDRPYRGYAFMGAAALSLGSTLWLSARAAQANNVYEGAPIAVRQQAYDQASSYASARNALLATTAFIWAVNAAESYFLFGTRDR
jgi:hypothetical protein